MSRKYKIVETDYDVYRYILQYKQEHDGCAPSLREIVDNTPASSTSHASKVLNKLEKEGMIVVEEWKTRSIEVTGAMWIPPRK